MNFSMILVYDFGNIDEHIAAAPKKAGAVKPRPDYITHNSVAELWINDGDYRLRTLRVVLPRCSI